MAQDFYAAYHLGSDNKHISTVDEGGVALAGVQALYRLNLKKDRKIAKLQREDAQLEAMTARLARASNAKDAKLSDLALQNRKLASQVAELDSCLRGNDQLVAALEARLARDEAQDKATRVQLARVMRNQKEQPQTELAHVQF